jgi:hypothetical protein
LDNLFCEKWSLFFPTILRDFPFQNLEFEKAAQLRDQIVEMRQIMVLKETEGV